MQNYNSNICPFANVLSGHALLSAFLCDDGVMGSTGAPFEGGSGD